MKNLLIAFVITFSLVTVGSLLIGCEQSPAGPSFVIEGDNNSVQYTENDGDVTTGDENEGDIDLNGGGCCDDDGAAPKECFSIPSGTPLPYESCVQGGGSHDCDCS